MSSADGLLDCADVRKLVGSLVGSGVGQSSPTSASASSTPVWSPSALGPSLERVSPPPFVPREEIGEMLGDSFDDEPNIRFSIKSSQNSGSLFESVSIFLLLRGSFLNFLCGSSVVFL